MGKKYEMQAFSSFEDIPDEYKDKVMSQMTKINRILNKHSLQDDDTIYMHNSIRQIIMDYVEHWPEPPMLLCCESSSSYIKYFETMLNNMIQKYIKHRINIGEMLPYDKLMSYPIIDITKACRKSTVDKISSPDIVFYEAEVDTLRNYDWCAFIPCFEKFIVKINKKRFLFIERLSLNKKEKTMTISISDYLGGKYELNKMSDCIIKLSFDKILDTESHLPCEWEFIEIESYEEKLIKFINDMNWSQDEIRFWLDCFDISLMTDMYVVTLDLPIDLDGNTSKSHNYVIYSNEDMRQLKEECGPYVHIQLSGNEAKQHFKENWGLSVLLRYMKIIATINYQLLCYEMQKQNNNNENDTKDEMINDDASTNTNPDRLQKAIKRQIGNITITSVNPPKLMIDKSINYNKESWSCKGGIRHMKSGKIVPYAGCVKHRKKPIQSRKDDN